MSILKKITRHLIKYFIKIDFLNAYYHKLRYNRSVKESTAIENDINIQVINYNVNDICNSKCTMCNIWKQKQGFELSPGDLKKILSDDAFTNITHIGLTGGEPTLRKDLSDLFSAIIEIKPTIEGLSLITNSINLKDVKLRIQECYQVCKKADVNFSVMISLDGIGSLHDKVRGTEGNFNKVMNLYEYLNSLGIQISTGTTISKINVWDVDDILDFLKDNNIYGRFRIAEFIKRLVNDDLSDVIRNFNNDEIYHLTLFFYKLIFRFEENPIYQNTYYNIINMLNGGSRIIACPYQKNGIVLGADGAISYCAPKSPIIGRGLDKSAKEIIEENKKIKEDIIHNKCKDCIHDYHAEILWSEQENRRKREFWKSYLSLESLIPFQSYKLSYNAKIELGDSFNVLITGWYGTETVGDKAILAGIIQNLKRDYGPEIKIFVSSLYPIISKRTLLELNIEGTVIDCYSEEFIKLSCNADIVVMGGGPLMDLDELALPLFAFKLARKFDKKTIVYGCGIGPLNGSTYIAAVKEILFLSSEVKLRDSKSVKIAIEWGVNPSLIELTGDPAKTYLESKFLQKCLNKNRIITCYLRELPREYFSHWSDTEYHKNKQIFEKQLSLFIRRIANEKNIKQINFCHMHNFVVGEDDRDFSRYFIKNYFDDEEFQVTYDRKLSTVDSIISSMNFSEINICMRFHSVLFAHTLNSEFYAVDYTSGGKIKSYLVDNKALDKLFSMNYFLEQKNS